MNFHVVDTEFEIIDGLVIETKDSLNQQLLEVTLPIEGILTFKEMNNKGIELLRIFTGKALGLYINYHGSFFLLPKMKLHCFLEEALPDGTAEIQREAYGLLLGPDYLD